MSTYSVLALAAFSVCAALSSPGADAQTLKPVQGSGAAANKIRVGSVSRVVTRAAKLRRLDAGKILTAHVAFRFANPADAQAYANAVSDPNSLLCGQWLTPQEIGLRFGPDAADVNAMIQHLRARGVKITGAPPSGMALTIEGTAAQMEAAFGTELNEYREAKADASKRGPSEKPREFFANATPLQLPAALAPKIAAVIGLQNYTRPIPKRRKREDFVSGNYDMAPIRTAYDLAPLYNSGLQGQGRTVGITNFDGVDVATNGPPFISFNGLPVPAGGATSNVSRVTVGNSSGTGGAAEGDLDFQMVLGMAPLANIIIYDSSNDVYGVIMRELSDNLADIVTESYGYDILDNDTASAFHDLHTQMTMQGITYLSASGDSGSIVNDPYPYSDYEPDTLVIGGTILTYNATTNAYASETGWGGSGGGYTNVAADINVIPPYQKGRGVPTAPNQRFAPDISLHASGDHSAAYRFYYQGNLNAMYIGTSFACPVTAGCLAVTEQYLAQQGALPANSAGKQRLGRLNDKIYGFNGRNDVFHDITTGYNGFPATPYYDLVTGWGTPDFSNLAAALKTPLVVTVTPSAASPAFNQTVNLTANVVGTNVKGVTWSLASGPGSVSASGVYTAPANFYGVQTAVVKATSVLDTANPGNANAVFQPDPVFGQATITLSASATISGVVHLEGIPNPTATVVPVHPVTFVFTPVGGGSPVTFSKTLGSGGAFSITGLTSNAYTLSVKGDKWLRVVVSADTSGGNVTNINVTLPAGDANNDNTVDVGDFGLLINAYGALYDANNPNNGYDYRADFNNDGHIDVGDFGLMVNNYNDVGQ